MSDNSIVSPYKDPDSEKAVLLSPLIPLGPTCHGLAAVFVPILFLKVKVMEVVALLPCSGQ
jgi:hypothetical protein